MFIEGLKESIAIKEQILRSEDLLHRLQKSASLLSLCFQSGNKVLFCGNGGSAADAQHLAAELSGRFYLDRPALAAEALHVNTSFLTAVANDYGFDRVFARMVEALGKENDVLIGLSTSGNSPNILAAFDAAIEKGMHCIAFTGETGGQLKEKADILINVPSRNTPRIQENHIFLGHLLCEWVEKDLFSTEG